MVARRKEAGFNASYAFAEHIGLDKTYVGRIEKGERPPSPAFCVAAAKGLGLSADYVLKIAGLADESKRANEEDYTDVEETNTILKTFPNPESKRRAIRITNNILREMAQDARENSGQVERNANDPARKTPRRNAAA